MCAAMIIHGSILIVICKCHNFHRHKMFHCRNQTMILCECRSPVPARKLNHLSAENMPIKNSVITSVPRTATSLKRLSECSLCSSTGDNRNPVRDIGKFHWYFSPPHHRADPVHETPKSQGGQVLSSKLLDADNSGGHASGSTK